MLPDIGYSATIPAVVLGQRKVPQVCGLTAGSLSMLFCSQSVDMWAIGVIMFTLISGNHPFYQRDTTKMFIKVAAGDCEFSNEAWQYTSDGAKVWW